MKYILDIKKKQKKKIVGVIKISNWKVAGYLRLSKEDNENIESNSIVNQRELIDQYISSKEDLELVDYYIDDG